LRAEHSSASSESRRGLAEIVAVVLGLTSIILYAALKLAPWLIEPGDLPLDEVVGDFVPYLLFGPPLLLTCPGTVVALVVAVLQRRGRLRASTWLLALPAVLLSVQFAVSSIGARPPPELRPIPVDRSPILCRRPSRQCRPSRAGELLNRHTGVSRLDEVSRTGCACGRVAPPKHVRFWLPSVSRRGWEHGRRLGRGGSGK